MRIKIDGNEREYELRALAVLFGLLADGRAAKEAEWRREEQLAGKVPGPIPNVRTGEVFTAPLSDLVRSLKPNDSPPVNTQFEVVDFTDTSITIAPVSTEFPFSPTSIDPRDAGFQGHTDVTPTQPTVPIAPAEAANETKTPRKPRAKKGGEQLQLVPAAPEASPAPPAPEAPPAPLAPAVPEAPVAAPAPVTAPVAPQAPAAPATPAATLTDVPQTFPEFMRKISRALASKKLTADALNTACKWAAEQRAKEEPPGSVYAGAGVTNLQGLLQHQDLVPAVFGLVGGHL